MRIRKPPRPSTHSRLFSDIVRMVEGSEVWDEATGAMFPQRTVFVPPSFFGARAKSFSEREREEKEERAGVARRLEDELVEDGVLEAPIRAEVPAVAPGPTADGEKMEVTPARADVLAATPGPTAGGEEGEEDASARRMKRSVARKERRARRAEE